MTEWHLAQLNVATLRQPIEHPDTAEFADNLDPVNAVAEASPGYVWRLQDESGNATGFMRDGDPLRIPNLTVWESIEALRDYMYGEAHVPFMRKRRDWFEAHTEPHFVMWWIPAGHIPTLEEAEERLAKLQAEGPTRDAFTFKPTFDPPDE
ncbi:MAG: hypothetical protein DHS20C19_25190 [Acidimicrobiales bacterium]|nr:MAG: hypothetical protein DHS20C19_25190 [Acidimicrobiales bacterium]